MQFLDNTGPSVRPSNQIVFSMPKISPSSNMVMQNTFANRLPQGVATIPVPNNFQGQYFANSNIGTYRRVGQVTARPPPAATPSIPPPQNGPPTGKLRWGPPIWELFHTLAEKIKPEHFTALKSGILNSIYSICANLPCPDCANHATQYLNGINFNVIKTKDDLKNMLFRFHNSVNLRKGAPAFDYAELTPKYSSANTSIIIQKFMDVFAKKSYNIRMIADDFQRNRVIGQLKQWLSNHLQFFEP